VPHVAKKAVANGGRLRHLRTALHPTQRVREPTGRRNDVVLTISALVVPELILALTPWRGFGEVLFVGTIPGLIGLMHGRRFAVAAPTITAILVAVFVAVGSAPIIAAIVMALVGLGVGASSLKGWQTVAVVMTSWPSVLLIAPPLALTDTGWLSGKASVIVLAGAATFLGGAWTFAVTAILLPHPPTGTFTPEARSTSIVYGASLAVLLAGISYAATTWAPRTMAGWILLTVLVIARPGLTETRQRILARALGTITGGILAALVGLLIPVPMVISLVGLLCLAAAVLLQLKISSYALYSVALTASIVLLNSRANGLVSVDSQRVLFTMLGVVLAGLLVVVLQFVLIPAIAWTSGGIPDPRRTASARSSDAYRQR